LIDDESKSLIDRKDGFGELKLSKAICVGESVAKARAASIEDSRAKVEKRISQERNCESREI
jgi:hypothetical protein